MQLYSKRQSIAYSFIGTNFSDQKIYLLENEASKKITFRGIKVFFPTTSSSQNKKKTKSSKNTIVGHSMLYTTSFNTMYNITASQSFMEVVEKWLHSSHFQYHLCSEFHQNTSKITPCGLNTRKEDTQASIDRLKSFWVSHTYAQTYYT